MKFEYQRYEIMTSIAADVGDATWVADTTVKSRARVRVSGKFPVSATRHSLLVTALVNALRSIQLRQAEELARLAGQPKPRLLVVSDDISLVDALAAIISGDKKQIAKRYIKATPNFTSPLEQQLARFVVAVQMPPAGDGSLLALRRWSRFTHATIAMDGLAVEMKPDIVAAFV